MATRQRVSMPRAQRAKQFAPFSALVGFDLALEVVRERNRLRLEQEIVRLEEPETEPALTRQKAEELRWTDPKTEEDPVYWSA